MAYNYEFLLPIINPTSLVYRGMAHNWSDLRLNVANGDVYYYSFVSSPTKHTVIYNRVLNCGEGAVRLDLIASPTSFTPGVVTASTNLFLGQPQADVIITRGATDVVGGTAIRPEFPVAYVGSAGNNTPVSGAAMQPTIIPPNTTVIARIESSTTGTNPWVVFSLSFSELIIKPNIYQGN